MRHHTPTMQIALEHTPSQDRLRALGVTDWPTWGTGVARFPWAYDERETCYVLAGEVVVTPDGGMPVTIRAGDLPRFPPACRAPGMCGFPSGSTTGSVEAAWRMMKALRASLGNHPVIRAGVFPDA